jgi:hypothetical protein
VQVHVLEALQRLEEQAGLVELADRVVEVELSSTSRTLGLNPAM